MDPSGSKAASPKRSLHLKTSRSLAPVSIICLDQLLNGCCNIPTVPSCCSHPMESGKIVTTSRMPFITAMPCRDWGVATPFMATFRQGSAGNDIGLVPKAHVEPALVVGKNEGRPLWMFQDLTCKKTTALTNTNMSSVYRLPLLDQFCPAKSLPERVGGMSQAAPFLRCRHAECSRNGTCFNQPVPSSSLFCLA